MCRANAAAPRRGLPRTGGPGSGWVASPRSHPEAHAASETCGVSGERPRQSAVRGARALAAPRARGHATGADARGAEGGAEGWRVARREGRASLSVAPVAFNVARFSSRISSMRSRSRFSATVNSTGSPMPKPTPASAARPSVMVSPSSSTARSARGPRGFAAAAGRTLGRGAHVAFTTTRLAMAAIG